MACLEAKLAKYYEHGKHYRKHIKDLSFRLAAVRQ